MANYSIAVSIVTYETDRDILNRCIESALNAELNCRLSVIDNSPSDKLKEICKRDQIDFVFNPGNSGYGSGHNIAIRKTISQKIKYHLVINPDIYFEKSTIDKLFDFMESNTDVGLVMPKVLYPDGSVQYLCKLLPTPMDLIRRRVFHPLASGLINF